MHQDTHTHTNASYHATIGALRLCVPRQSCQRFLILCVDQLTDAAVQGILGVGLAKLALTWNTQHGYCTLVGTIVHAELRISQTLKRQTQNLVARIPFNLSEGDGTALQNHHMITMQNERIRTEGQQGTGN